MKVRRKKIKILFIVISLIVGIKIYFEINANIFDNKVEKVLKMDLSEHKIKTIIAHKTLKLDEYEVHYYVSGKENADLIIFLHPAFSDHRAFDQQIDFFSKTHRVITIDLIGHGLSKAKKTKDKIDASSEHISKIIEIEGYDNAHLVGVSMGSLIAQYFAFQYPQKATSLTALGGYNIHEESKEVVKAQRSINFSLIFRAIFSMKAFRKMAAKITCESEKGQALFYKSASHYERKSFMVMQGLQNIIKDRDSVKLKHPTLMLTGEFDIELAKKMGKKWHTEVDNSKYSIIERAGHCANMDRPNEFNKIVNGFIEAIN